MEKDLFVCEEETSFFSHCLQALLLEKPDAPQVIVELGPGDGTAVLNALSRSGYSGRIYGYEINATAAEQANRYIEERQLERSYSVTHASFFEAPRPEATHLISSTPYIPAPDEDIYLPGLYGGPDGALRAKQLLDCGYESTMLLVSSYANPLGVLEHAKARGYAVVDFLAAPMHFGYYSSEPKVRQQIEQLAQQGIAFYTDSIYLVAGVLFQHASKATQDLSIEVEQVLSALKPL